MALFKQHWVDEVEPTQKLFLLGLGVTKGKKMPNVRPLVMLWNDIDPTTYKNKL